MKRGYKLGKVCGCGSPVSDNSASGLCRPCFMQRLLSDPERGKKVSAGLKRYLEKPENFAKHLEQARRAGRTKAADPVRRAKMAKVMREKVQPLSMTPENLAKRDYSVTGARSRETKLSWLPREYWDEYRYLTKVKKMTKLEAASVITATIRAKELKRRAEEARLSPFERQERALKRGAQLVANDISHWSDPKDHGEAKWSCG